MTTLIICEKPSQAKDVLRNSPPDTTVLVCPCVVSYRFKYISELRFADVPYHNEEVKYHNNITDHINYPIDLKNLQTMVIHNGEEAKNILFERFYNEKEKDSKSIDYIKTLNEVHDYIASFDEIVFGCDMDHTGVRGFTFLFDKYFEIEDFKIFTTEHNISVNTYHYKNLNDKGFVKTIKNKKTFFSNENIIKHSRVYKNKDFFDYNYNMNSLMLFNKAYKEATGIKNKQLMTKNFISALFIIKKYNEENDNKYINEYILSEILNKKHICSHASRGKLINFIMESKLVNYTQPKSIKENIHFNESGIKFLSLLHRKVDDPHLTDRLFKDYKTLSINDFNQKYSRYLTSVFGKQKRLVNKMI